MSLGEWRIELPPGTSETREPGVFAVARVGPTIAARAVQRMRALPSTTSRATCEGCGAIHEIARPTPSFRCEHCIAAEVDAAAARTRRRAFSLFGIGALLLLVTALLWSTGRNFDQDGWSTPLPLEIGFAALGCFGVGVGMLRFRPKLRL